MLAGVDAAGLVNLLSGEGFDVANGVDEDARALMAVDDDNAALGSFFDKRVVKAGREVDHWNDAAAEVDDSADVFVAIWQGSDRLPADNLAHFEDVDAVHHAFYLESQDFLQRVVHRSPTGLSSIVCQTTAFWSWLRGASFSEKAVMALAEVGLAGVVASKKIDGSC